MKWFGYCVNTFNIAWYLLVLVVGRIRLARRRFWRWMNCTPDSCEVCLTEDLSDQRELLVMSPEQKARCE